MANTHGNHNRRLAAVLVADIVGFTRLMEADESGTFAAITACRKEIWEPTLTRHGGRIVKVTGDGVLVEFASAIKAVDAASELQQQMRKANEKLPDERRVLLRIGINLGDVIGEGDDIYGEGVNIASRLEGLAAPGGICVSGKIYEEVRGKVPVAFEYRGDQQLKNLSFPVRVYRASPDGETVRMHKAPRPADTRSIAVLPFANISGEPEQEYFSDGITEDIITDLSKVSALNVLSRNTSFAFKHKSTDIGHLAAQLKVTYIVEGSVRKAGSRVRITAQLVDADKDSHMWAERYDRDLNDIFAVQDEISRAIVSALRVKLLPEEQKAIAKRSTSNPEAYQYYLMARQYALQQSRRNTEIAMRFCQRAVEIDPRYARAWALIASCRATLRQRGVSEDWGLSDAEKALGLDQTLADAHAAKGQALAGMGRFEEALVAHRESLRLDPESYDVNVLYAATCTFLGRHAEAAEHYRRAAEAHEGDLRAIGLAYQAYESLGRHDEAQALAQEGLVRVERAVSLARDDAMVSFYGACILAYLGQKERAKEWTVRALILDPDDSLVRYNCACALAQLGEGEEALDLLESCLDKMSADFVNWIKNDSDLSPLREHPRYQALVGRGEARLLSETASYADAPVPRLSAER